VDVMSIMIGRNNSRAPWQVGEDRVCGIKSDSSHN
jgi:hypothetical protein